jgi:multicomponent Na+:H+ antiporter subunit D
MSVLPVLPLLIPLVAAIASLAAWRSRVAQRALGLAGTAASLVASLALLVRVLSDGIQVLQVGSWEAPFGITLVADVLAAVMVVLGSLSGLATAVYSLGSIDRAREEHGYWPLVHLLLMGVSGAFLTGDLFNLYVWFEVLLMASFVLLALGGSRSQLEGTVKYVVLSLMSSALFLAAVGLLYGMAGTLNMADLALRLRAHPSPGLVTAVGLMLLAAYGIKAAVFPVFSWLPASYHTAPAPVSALFAGLLTKVGVYALLRVFTLVFTQDTAFTHGLILGVAGLTMVTGVLGAAAQGEARRILSFHIVSQIGYMIMGLGLLTPLALAGSVFYLMHHIVVKTNLFLVAGLVERLRGTGRLERLGGLWSARAWLGLLFLVPAFSLAGIPPLSGFWAKLVLLKAGIDARSWGIVACAAVVSLLTLYSMTKIWAEAFWKAAPVDAPAVAAPTRGQLAAMVAPIVALALVTLAIGVGAGPVLDVAQRAADELIDPSVYIEAVLGPGGAR